MNKSEFEELINLYFDREISAKELKCLKKELATNASRRHEFKFRYHLHQATCSVLSAEDVRFSGQAIAKNLAADQAKYRPSLTFGLGMAACLLVLLTTSILIMREPTNESDTFVVKTSNSPEEVRSVENQALDIQFQKNLSSQLRLAGLTPDIAPSNQQFSRVDTEALQKRDTHLQDIIEQMNRYRTYSAVLQPQLVESSGRTYESPSSSQWPKGFKSSLASFK